LTIAFCCMHPQCALPCAHRRNERASIRGERDALLLCCAEGHLLGFAIRKFLPPYVVTVSYVGGEIHPLAVWRPLCARALCRRWSDNLCGHAWLERHHAARTPPAVHFHDKHLIVIR